MKKSDPEQLNPPQYIVGMGASAGGLEAIEHFFTNMPADSGIAFVVIQHLSPDYKSLMVELLSKRTAMQVCRAEEGLQVSSDTVYLIPPKKNLTIFHGKLILSEQDHTRGLNLPIDVFLKSLADDQGEKAVGIILSGTGSDGMRGIRAVKEQGGMVMVQDEESAKFDGMPRSAISTGLVDFILPPDEMPQELISFIKHPYVSRNKQASRLLTDEDNMTRIFSLLRERHKIDFTHYKMSTVIRRIERRMTVNQVDKLLDFVRVLESDPREVTTLYRELLIGVTNFFRDPEVFEEMAQKWIPDLLAKKGNAELRLWIAGCSTGEEAYSLAILCREAMEKMGRSLDVKIFATDVDQNAVMFAGNGIYPESIAADIDPLYLSKYFFKRDSSFQIARTIREMVVFAHHNLIKDPPFTNIDLISCRNLLIYLQPVLQRKVLEFFNFSLDARGILLLGTSESVGEMLDNFEPLHHKWKIYRSRGRRRQHTGTDMPVTIPGRVRLARSMTGSGRLIRAHEEERVLDRFLKGLEGDYLPLSMVINEQMELLHLIGDSAELLRLPSGKVVNDITKMVSKDLSIPLATGLQKVFKNRTEVKYTNIHLIFADVPRSITMRIKPLPEKKGQEPLAAVFIEEIKEKKTGPSGTSASYDVSKETHQRMLDLEQELQYTRENLQATIEELETSNEELQATNEELLASNEELQSTNEELQSVNEELHTVNSEYQAKIIELTELNNDIENLMGSTQIGTLFLDENLEIRKFTPQTAKVISIIDKDLGRPLRDLTHRLRDLDLNALVTQVQNSAQPYEQEVCTVHDEWFLMRILPYYIGPRTFSGVLLTFTDIQRLKTVQRNLEEAMKIGRMAWWEMDVQTGRVHCSRRKITMLGYAPEDFANPEYKDFTDIIHPDDYEQTMRAMRDHLEGTAEIYEVDYRIRSKTGGYIWFSDRGAIISRDENGAPQTVMGMVIDNTQRKIAEASLQRALEQAREREKEEESLLKGARSILMHADFETAARNIFDACRDLIGASAGYVALLSQDGGNNEVVFLESGGMPCDVDPALPMPIRGLREEAYRTGKTAFNNHFMDSEWVSFLPGGHVALDNVLFAPLSIEGRTQGVMGLANKPGGFTENDIRLAAAFAELAAVALKNSRNDLALQESITQYDALFSSMLDGFALHEMIFDKKGAPKDYRFIKVNSAFEKMTGLKAASVIGRTVLDILPDTETAWIKKYGRIVQTGKPAHFENFSRELNKYFEVAAFRSSPGHFVTIVRDITERKNAEKDLQSLNRKLEKSEAWLKAAASMAQIGAWEIDLHTGKTFWTDQVYQIHEVPPDYDHDVDGGIQFYHPEDRPLLEQAVADTIKTGKPFDLECRFITAKHNLKWVRAIAQAEKKKGKVTRVFGAFQDITPFKQAQKNLTLSNAELASVYHAAPVGVGVVCNRIIRNVNLHLTEMTGYAKDELVGKSSRMLYHTKKEFERVGEEKYARISQKGMGTVITTWKTKDGKSIDIYLSAVPIDPEDVSAGITFTALELPDPRNGEKKKDASV